MLSRLLACLIVLTSLGLAAPEAAAQSSTERSETRSRRGASSEAPRRQRSEAQLANDQRMRQCGAEWRGMSTAQRGSRTWRTFMPECNRRLRGADTPGRSRSRTSRT